MGNCLRKTSNKVLSNEDIDMKDQLPQMELPCYSKEDFEYKKKKKKNSRVRFADVEEDRECKRSGSVRIRLVVTQDELKQILDYKKNGLKFTSLEQLLSEMRLRGRSVLEGNDDQKNGNWSPALESIPEDH